MKKFKVPAIIFTVITAICFTIFAIALSSMLGLSAFNDEDIVPIILLALTGMAIFAPATGIAIIPMIIFWVLYGKSKKKLNQQEKNQN